MIPACSSVNGSVHAVDTRKEQTSSLIARHCKGWDGALPMNGAARSSTDEEAGTDPPPDAREGAFWHNFVALGPPERRRRTILAGVWRACGTHNATPMGGPHSGPGHAWRD